MAFATRIKSWLAGETVSASDLNTELSIAINALSDGTKDANVAALTATTVTTSGNANITGNVNASGNAIAPLFVGANQNLNQIDNLGLTLSSGLITITDAVGSALSATNYGTITCPSATAGSSQRIKIATPITFRDHSNATPDFVNTEFGVNASANWGNDMPFFIYVINNGGNAVADVDGNSAFCLSRSPCMLVTPASGFFAKKGVAPSGTDDQTSVFLLGSNYTANNYAALPCRLVGAIRMQYLTATHDWTVQTLGNSDGFGLDSVNKTLSKLWTMPVNQNGAGTSRWLLDNSGTAPIFTTNNYVYRIGADGFITCFVYLVGDGGTDGAGSVNSQLVLPTSSVTIVNTTVLSMGWLRISTTDYPIQFETALNNSYVSISRYTTSAGALQASLNALQNADFVNADRRVSGTFTYKAY